MGIRQLIAALFRGSDPASDAEPRRPQSQLEEKFHGALQDIRDCPDYNFLTATTENGRSFQVSHSEGEEWILNFAFDDADDLQTLLSSGLFDGLRLDECTEKSLMLSVEASGPDLATLSSRIAQVLDPDSGENFPAIEVYCSEQDEEKASKSDILAVVGSLLAEEAKKMALEGSSSALIAVREMDYPLSHSRDRLRFELYVFHLAAFAEATMTYGADGLQMQAAMINAAPSVANGIVDRGEDMPRSEAECRNEITDRLEEYVGVLPVGASDAQFLQFGGLVAERIFGSRRRDPYAALIFVQLFQTARDTCSDLITRLAKSLKG